MEQRVTSLEKELQDCKGFEDALEERLRFRELVARIAAKFMGLPGVEF